jgi:carboxylesterase
MKIYYDMSNKQNPVTLHELAKPYHFKSASNDSRTLVILVHGFGASTTETRPLAEFLQGKGYDIYGVLLSGHGTQPSDLDKISWKDWIKDVNDIFKKEHKNYEKIFIGGISLGGSISLYGSTEMNFSGVFTINAFYRFPLLYRLLTWFLHFFKYHKPRNERRIKWYQEHNLYSYSDDSTFAAYQIIKLLRNLHRRIKKLNIPTLIIQSQTDKTISPTNAEFLYKNLRTKKEIFRVPQADHILTVDENRFPAFEKIAIFIKEVNNG